MYVYKFLILTYMDKKLLIRLLQWSHLDSIVFSELNLHDDSMWCFADVEVSCVLMESCILPCEFQAGAEVVIRWNHLTAGDTQVHYFYHNRDQVSLQNERFKGRTKLFKDQISRGNASLQLTGVEFKDKDRYKCYTSTIFGNKESFINIKVHGMETHRISRKWIYEILLAVHFIILELCEIN